MVSSLSVRFRLRNVVSQQLHQHPLHALQWTLLDSLITESSLYNFAMAFAVQPNSETTVSISRRKGSIYSGCDAMSNKRCVMAWGLKGQELDLRTTEVVCSAAKLIKSNR